MNRLDIQLFGAPSVALDGSPVAINRNKSMALLAYLALAGDALRRDALATLLWPELGQARARADLRRELTYLRDALGTHWLVADRETVALAKDAIARVDVLEFLAALEPVARIDASGNWVPDASTIAQVDAAVALYRGDFLDGFSLRDAPEFDAWQYYTAEDLRRRVAWALALLLRAHRNTGNLNAACEVARRRLAIDPLDEAICADLIGLYLEAGSRTAALRQYERCVAMLEQEMGVPPSAALLARGKAITASAEATTAQLPDTTARATGQGEAEIRMVVGLSLSVLPVSNSRNEPGLEQTALSIDAFLPACRERLGVAGARLLYSSSESTLAVFGAVIACEDDAERCIQCAFDLHEAATEHGLAVAIGIASGQAYVRAGGESGSAADAVIGPVLNLAADLQRAAGRGQLFVDRATYLLTRGSVDYTPAETRAVRGRSVEVRRALRLRMAAEKARGIAGLRSRMVGRDQELRMLQNALACALGGDGQVAFVIGDAGLGKSRLVAELKASVLGSGIQESKLAAPVRWLVGRSRVSTAAVGFAPFADLLRIYFGWHAGACAQERAAVITACLADLCRAGHLGATDADEVAAVLGIVYAVHFGNTRDDLLRHADPAQVRYRALMALAKLLTALARQRPLLLVLEDLHWADSSSLDLIRVLLARLDGAQMFLLCVFRPGADYECTQLPSLAARRAAGRVTEIELCELSRPEMHQLLDSLFDRHQLPASLMSRVVNQAQGNPFFAEEVVRSLIDAEQIVRVGGEWRAAPSSAGSAPPPVALSPEIGSLVLSRLDRLAVAHRSLVQAAAVLGMSFDLRVLEALNAAPVTDEALHELERRGYLLCERQTPYAEYTFKHVLLQEAIYHTVPAPRRAALHEQAAQAIERLFPEDDDTQVEQLAYHFLNTDNHAAALRYLVRAGNKARHSFLNASACAHLMAALEICTLLDPHKDNGDYLGIRAGILQQLGRIHYSNGAFGEAEIALRDAIEMGEAGGWEIQKIIHLVYWLGEALFWQGKLEALEREAVAALTRLGDDRCTLESVLMLGHWAAATCSLGRHDVSVRIIERLATQVQALPYSEELSPVYDHIIDNQVIDQKNPVSAQLWIDALKTRAAANHDLNSQAKAIFAESTLLHNCGAMEASLQAVEQASNLVEVTGEETLRFFCLLRFAELALVRGDLAVAEQLAAQGLGLIEDEQGGSTFRASQFAAILLGAGQVNTALDWLRRAEEDVELPVNLHQHILLFLARAQAAAGLDDAASGTCRKAMLLCRPEFLPYSTLPLFRSMAAAFLAMVDATCEDATWLQALCEEIHAVQPDFADMDMQFWYLRAGTPQEFGRLVCNDTFPAALADRWEWLDPSGNATCRTGDGLLIRAGDGCDLWHLNFLAPRVLTALDGDFAIQVASSSPDLPGVPMGGLCLWGNEHDFISLSRGIYGLGEISLTGSLANRDRVIGRGRLAADTLHFRLERHAGRVRGLCSANGVAWYLVGETQWAWAGTLLAGPYVAGLVDRTLYPGAPPDGGILCFDYVRIWQG